LLPSSYPHAPPFLQPQVEGQEQLPPLLVHVQPPMIMVALIDLTRFE
jgi:hypothetical protein